MPSETPSTPAIKGSAFLVAPRRRRHRRWFTRRLRSKRGRFEVALVGGGAIALTLGALLPGAQREAFIIYLSVAWLVMTTVSRMVGFAPSIAAAIFAPLVIALTDPMWTLGTSLADFTLAEESAAVLVVFLLAAIVGSTFHHLRLRVTVSHRQDLWSATPRSQWQVKDSD